jgi:Flp pilus assembly protein TadD
MSSSAHASFEAGVAAHQRAHYKEAEAHYLRAIEQDPGHAAALNNLGIVLDDTHRADEAEACYRHAISLNPAYVDAYCNLAARLADWQRWTDAQTLLEHALTRQSDHAALHLKLARLHARQQHRADAEHHYREALRLRPADATIWSALGILLHEQDRLADAEACYREALQHDAESIAARGNLGNLLNDSARYDEAQACFRRLLDTSPDSIEALNNLGRLLEDAHRLEEAEACYRRVLSLDPSRIPTELNLSMLLLMAGRLDEAWPLYESRYAESAFWGDDAALHVKPRLPFPEWRGEPLEGRSLLILTEQGFGDSLHFARYFPWLKRRGLKQLTVACPGPLASLFREIEGVDACIARDDIDAFPEHDFWCFTMSLPLRFNTTLDTIPASMPYLRAPADRAARWAKALPRDGRLKVGLVWAGDPRPTLASAHKTDRRRSLDAQAYLPLLRVPGVTFVSLQMGASTRPQIGTLPQALRPLDPMDDVKDFADTAAIIEQLDLVITVDTSVSHLAGALGKPVWILSRFDGCWRWLLDRNDSPWYPTATLFRQTQPGEWRGVIERVEHALREWTHRRT